MPANETVAYCVSCEEDFFSWDAYDNHMRECPECELEYCGVSYSSCPDECMSRHSGRGIYDWDYRPDLKFHGDGPYHLGFELEISASSYDVSPIYRWCETNNVPDMLYVKEDGSVEGFEIVSHPMTPEFFDTLDWESFFTMLQRHYPINGDERVGHGLHVHVSRTAFTRNSTLARWCYLLNRNVTHVQRVARRTDQRWCAFTEYPVSAVIPYDGGQPSGEWRIDYDNPLSCGCCYPRNFHEFSNRGRLCRQFQNRIQPHSRYMAVNLTNTDTVEVRVFRSTRKPDEFIRSIHLVAATVDFARTMQPWHATRLATSWDAFVDYVKAHPVFTSHADVFSGVPAMPPDAVVATPAIVREWARNNGYAVGSRGRIPEYVIRDYVQTDHGTSVSVNF